MPPQPCSCVQRHSERLAGVKRARAAAFEILSLEVLPALEAVQSGGSQGVETDELPAMDVASLSTVLQHIRAAHKRLLERKTESAPGSSSIGVKSRGGIAGLGGERRGGAQPPDTEGVFATSPKSAPPPFGQNAGGSPLRLSTDEAIAGAAHAGGRLDSGAEASHAGLAQESLQAADARARDLAAAAEARNRQFDLQMQALESRQLRQLQERTAARPDTAAPPLRPQEPRVLQPSQRGLAGGWGGLAADLAASDAAAAAARGSMASFPPPLVSASAPSAHALPAFQQGVGMAGINPFRATPSASTGLATGLLAAALKATRGIAAAPLPPGGGGMQFAPAPQAFAQSHLLQQPVPRGWQMPVNPQSQSQLGYPPSRVGPQQHTPRPFPPQPAAYHDPNSGGFVPNAGGSWPTSGDLTALQQQQQLSVHPSAVTPGSQVFRAGAAPPPMMHGGFPRGPRLGVPGMPLAAGSAGRGASATLPAWMTGRGQT